MQWKDAERRHCIHSGRELLIFYYPIAESRDLGIWGLQVLVTEVDGQRTAYILIDGNNMAQGVREVLLEQVLKIVDNAEVMTTDSHVVNTITGKNPVGMHVPASEFLPFVMQALQTAIDDLAPSEVAGSTAHCEHIVVFGSNRISELPVR